MPLPLPSSQTEQDLFYKLFKGGKSAVDSVENWYLRNIPSNVRRNISDMIDTPIPGNPFAAGKGIVQGGDAVMEAATAFPLLVKALQTGKLTKNQAKLAQKLKEVFKIEPGNIIANRFQREAVDIPVSQSSRGGTFFSHGPDYSNYELSPVGAEGGPNKVVTNLPVKNPFFLKL